MSLFSSIQLANNALKAAQIGLQVTGNNIANADTPGYIREEMVLTPAPTQKKGNLLLGLGVQIEAIVQKSDAFLESRLRGAVSDLASGEAQENAYLELEAIIGELTDTDLSTSLTRFFASINDILNQAGDSSVRNLAVLQGERVTQDVNRLADRVRSLRKDANDQVIAMANDINRLTEEVAELNVRIVTAEGGNSSPSDAVGLRDQRLIALEELSKLIGIKAVEQTTGSVTVFVSGEYLVAEGFHRDVRGETTTDRGVAVTTILLAETNAPLDTGSGELAGLVAARDQIHGGFLDRLDEFSRTFIFEFNKLYSNGQGLSGYNELTGEFAVDDTTAALDSAGLEFLPINGSFQVKVFDKQTELPKTTDVLVKLNGTNDDTSLDDLAAALSAIDGLTATISSAKKLKITTDSPNSEFAFAEDTSGVLAALGINTFFTGSSAEGMGINEVVKEDPGKFAASNTGIGPGTGNAEQLAAFLDRELESENGMSLAMMYDRLTSEVTQGAAVSRSVADGFRVFQRTLEGQKFAVSGVSLDEEAIRMIGYQRAYQASARFIATVSDLLDILVNL